MQLETVKSRILAWYEATLAPWEILQPVATWLLEGSEAKFRHLVQQSRVEIGRQLAQRCERWAEYSQVRQVTWQNRLENFLEWYLAAGKSVMDTPREKCYPVTWLDPAYPQELTALSEPPPVLYANHLWGSWPWPARRVAVIGSRSMSRYGQLMTQEVVSDLVEESEAAVISGGARGVDLTAQQQALQLGGQTIGVCGCGLGKITSRSQQQLLGHPQALWVSEFPPMYDAQPWTFVQRNRLIAGLAQGLLVIEAQENSGTMITVRAALEQGKEVMIIPQSLWNQNASGIIRLANDGATLVTGADDIQSLLWPDQAAIAPPVAPQAIDPTRQGTRPVRQSADPLPTQQQQLLQLLKEYQGRMLLADLLLQRPRSVTLRQWRHNLHVLEKAQKVEVRYGVVQLKKAK